MNDLTDSLHWAASYYTAFYFSKLGCLALVSWLLGNICSCLRLVNRMYHSDRPKRYIPHFAVILRESRCYLLQSLVI